MKNPGYLLLFGLVLLLGFPGSTGHAIPAKEWSKEIHKIEKNSLEIERIKQRGTLRVAMHALDHPPFFMVSETGELIGLDVEIAKEIASILGVKLEINRDAQTFDDLVARIEAGKDDIAISKLSLTLERAEKVLYTHPYVTIGKSLLLNRFVLTTVPKGISVKDLFQMPEAKLGVIKQSSYEAFANHIFPHAEVHRDLLWERELVPLLLEGKVWALFRDELEIRRTMLMIPKASLNFLAVSLRDEQDPIMMVVNRNHLLLQQWINLYLKYTYQKRTLAQVIEQYAKYLRKENWIQ